MASSLFHELPIRHRDVFDGESNRQSEETVLCPHRKASTSVEDCKVCPFARYIKSDAVVCVSGQVQAPAGLAIGSDPRVDITEAAARTPLIEIVPRDVTCVRADVQIDAAARLVVGCGLRCLPVVDADGRLIGIVSKTDLVRDRAENEAPQMRVELEDGFHLEQISERTVSEIMSPCVHALPEDAPLAFAISLLAFEWLHEAPIVTRDGRVVGVVSALDVLRWLATRMGYEVPSVQSPQKTAEKST